MEFFYIGDLSFFLQSFINLFNILFILVQTHVYLFYTLCDNPIRLYLVAQIVLTLVLGSSFSSLLCPFDILPAIWVFFSLSLFFLPLSPPFSTHFLACIPGSLCMFSVPILELTVFPCSLAPFIGEHARNQDLGDRCSLCCQGIVPNFSHMIEKKSFFYIVGAER